eukprot:403347763
MEKTLSLQEQQARDKEIKRRSRNEQSGRDFKCQVCDRTYLSYPAMYTHMKNKHAIDPSGGLFSNNQQRSRGRPKRPNEFSRVDPTTDLYMKSEGRGGGPNDPIQGFEEVYKDLASRITFAHTYENYKQHPLSEILAKYSQNVTPFGDIITEDQLAMDDQPDYQARLASNINQPSSDADLQQQTFVDKQIALGDLLNESNNTNELSHQSVAQQHNKISGHNSPAFNIKRTTFKKLSTEIAQMSEEWRVMLSADEIFGLYLREVASKTNLNFYVTMVKYILLYRECMNEYGWQKLAESQCREAKQTTEERNINARLATFGDIISNHEYCSINNAEVAPEICNEFVTIFLESKKDCGLEKLECIDYTRNFCHWLFISGHTCSKLSLIT